MAAGQAKRRASRAPAEDALEPSPTGAFGRHLRAATAASALFLGFWSSRPDWDPEMRLWRAFGDASLVLLAASLALGPLARLWPRLARLLPIRRELGIDFAVLASIHTLLVLSGWVRWDLLRFLGYEYIDAAGRWVRLESGFGLANIAGVVALVWALILAGTSSDRATRFLGPSAWKWLHSGAYTIFYLVTPNVRQTFRVGFVRETGTRVTATTGILAGSWYPRSTAGIRLEMLARHGVYGRTYANVGLMLRR